MSTPRPTTLSDVPGLQVGHATDEQGITGCTVVLALDGAVGGVEVRGAAPGTRETDLLRPTALVERIHAVALCGGSAFGLAAADGVMSWLVERGIGFPTGPRPVPLVPAAVIFDLGLGSADAHATPELGRAACEAAERGGGRLEGSIGVGTGATVGKLAGPARATKGGVGTAALRLPDGATVGALAVTNAVGNVVDHAGRVIAGARGAEGGYIEAEALLVTDAVPDARPFGNTTLAVVGTDAWLDRAGCRKLAELAHDALALSIRPVHTMFDGDVVFTLSTGRGPAVGSTEMLRLGVAAVSVLREAIERSVLTAESRGGVPAARDA
jgi:L-aminopeptidase/D-esterase-like protein